VLLEHGRHDGARSDDGQILGTYLHGLFEQPAALSALLRWAGLERPQSADHAARREQMLDRLADAVSESLDLSAMLPGLAAAGWRS
jgi:adenosylcobyric acid synthase